MVSLFRPKAFLKSEAHEESMAVTDTSDIQGHFAARAATYDDSSHWCTDPVIGEKTVSLLGAEPGHHVLDVACGTGLVSRLFHGKVARLVGLDLTEEMAAGRFREDLYYRLSVVTLELPPLREHPEDILTMAEFFLNQSAAEAHRPTLRMSAEARRRLQSHHWPGNVRELRNMMERVAFLCPGERVESDDLAFIMSPAQEPASYLSPDLGLDKATRQFQTEFIRRAIKLSGGNMSEAARRIGVHRSNLYRKMRQLDMKEVAGSQ